MFRDQRHLILIYGRSLLLDTVEITLRQNGRFPVLRLQSPRRPQNDKELTPGTIIYDQDQMEGTAVLQLLTDHPGWRLIGLTASEGEPLVINSERGNGRSLTDLINFIHP